MARHRTIEENTILDAAERVIAQNGAANFTLEDVAVEAGISKGSVVRDCGSKQDLIRLIVKRRFNEWQRMLDQAELDQPVQGASGRIAAHVELTMAALPQEQRAVARNLCASLTNDLELTKVISEHYEREIQAVSAPGATAGARLAFLALEGMRSLEWFGTHSWPDGERQELLAEIGKLAQLDDLDPH
ncbi:MULTISPECIES: TetR/AcrR family transcriptional regulator [unclassified Devosia]|uniref:TetR/AcrR family transcriptional regulator n=1 Tax=unclassified Devosia TaxID=196773 RepID=UPI000FD79885|nr:MULTISPECIES: TetR/AcrR family transcriptional regulator [unclassified Devosia]